MKGYPLNQIKRSLKQHLSSSNHQKDFLRGLFRPACLARVVSWFAIVVAIFMAHESGDKRGPAGGRRVRGVLDEADPLSHFNEISSLPPNLCIIFVSFHFFS